MVWAVLVVILVIPILYPLPDIPRHVIDSIRTLPRLIVPHRSRKAIVIIDGGVLAGDIAVTVAEIEVLAVKLRPPRVYKAFRPARGFFPYRLQSGGAFQPICNMLWHRAMSPAPPD